MVTHLLLIRVLRQTAEYHLHVPIFFFAFFSPDPFRCLFALSFQRPQTCFDCYSFLIHFIRLLFLLPYLRLATGMGA